MNMTDTSEQLRRFTLAWSVRAPAIMLTIGIVVSVLVHVGVGAVALHKPIGYIDPADLAGDRQSVRVKRATYDLVLPSEPVPGNIPGSADGPAEKSIQDLSRDLLLQSPALLPDAAFEPTLEMRTPEEKPATPMSEELAIALPGFELPSDLLERLNARSPVSDVDPGGAAFETYAGGSVKLAGDLLAAGDGMGPGVASTSGSADGLDAAVMAATGLDLGLDGAMADSGDGSVDKIRLPIDDLLAPPIELPLELRPPQSLDDDFDYLLRRYDEAGQPGWFEIEVVPQRSLRKLRAMSKDVVFLVDTSSSLPQATVDQAVRGVRDALGTLNEGDRFNIVLFNERVRFFSPDRPHPATQANLVKAGDFLRVAKAEGYTDVNTALSRLLQRDTDADRVYNLVLISDGQPTRGVIDTRDLINLITRDNDLSASIYCVGIGRRPDRELLNFLAYRNKGFCLFEIDSQRTAATVVDLLSRIRYPLIKDVRLNIVGLDPSTVYPRDLPNIHQNQRFDVFGRYVVPGQFTMRILGRGADGPVDFTFNRDLERAPVGDRAIARDWAFWKLHHLYSEVLLRGETPALQRQIDELGERYDLKTLY